MDLDKFSLSIQDKCDVDFAVLPARLGEPLFGIFGSAAPLIEVDKALEDHARTSRLSKGGTIICPASISGLKNRGTGGRVRQSKS
jgi:hypothetical protein